MLGHWGRVTLALWSVSGSSRNLGKNAYQCVMQKLGIRFGDFFLELSLSLRCWEVDNCFG